MTEPSKPASAAQAMLDAAMDAEAARQRLAKRAFDATDTRTAKGGGKLSRSETVTVRLDPKLRYLAELAARLHRRTLSSYIEWSIESSLGNNLLAGDHSGPSIKDEAEYLWDVDDADRFAKLALRYPHLLTHEEQVRWKLIRENGYLWKGSYSARTREWTWTVDEASFIFQRLREHWIAFCRVADTGGGKDELPSWAKIDPNPPPQVRSLYGGSPPPARSAPPPRTSPPKSSTGFDDMVDDIPF